MSGSGVGGDGMGPGQESSGRSNGQDDDRSGDPRAGDHASVMARARGRFGQYFFTADDKRHHRQRDDQRFGRARGNADGACPVDPAVFDREHFAEDTRRRSPDGEGKPVRLALMAEVLTGVLIFVER